MEHLGRALCIITGASRGFGRAVAKEMARLVKPRSVFVLVARSGNELRALQTELAESDLEVRCVMADLSQMEALESVVRTAKEAFSGDIEHVILVNNAASLGDVSRFSKGFTNMAEVDSYLSLNITSALCLTASVLQAFPKQLGMRRCVVNISSLCAVKPFRSWVLYCTGKAARDMMFKVLAEEEPDLRVLNYAPAHTMTVGNMETVELFDVGQKGRGLRAGRDLSTGEVVFAEASFAAVVFDSLFMQVCHSCFRQQAKLHRCTHCQFAFYCNRTCQTACWDEHKNECAAIRKAGKAPNENVRLAARVLWRLHKDTGIVSDSQLISVEQLEDHVADLPQKDHEQLETDVQSFLEYWSCGKIHHSVDYISHIVGIIMCNEFIMSDQKGLQAVGVGLFPNLSLVNHDCSPNCFAVLNHGNQTAVSSALHSQRRIELRALGKIPEGQELTISYVDFLNLSGVRKKKLMERYQFECTCEHCSQHFKDDLMTAAAEPKASAEKLKEVTTFSEDCLEKIEKCYIEKDFHKVVKLCGECLEKQESVLADTHLYKLRVLSISTEVLLSQQLFSEAAVYAQRMVDGYTKLYPHNNAQLGLAHMHAGVIQWKSGKTELGHSLICKAYSILMVTHGPNHAITKDLESMRMQTELELKRKKLTSP
ncbi:histone-lysine N-methyltransferase Smyd1-like isoform X1 [Syngnathoides biaculeatus]|uniref:histone-lysine N-methyltransferase Smyd1-like isoform X1 n=1 Tax=Syngnathoides biaculeatus TaxID=300417 RepID=UPI002ADDA6C6|nr:histone-lysine N-methyltransferase Smyd1-like isoform X1 [Syngnathoides biaculeatus]